MPEDIKVVRARIDARARRLSYLRSRPLTRDEAEERRKLALDQLRDESLLVRLSVRS